MESPQLLQVSYVECPSLTSVQQADENNFPVCFEFGGLLSVVLSDVGGHLPQSMLYLNNFIFKV